MSANQPGSAIQPIGAQLPAELQDEIDRIRQEDKGVAYDPLPLRAHMEKDAFWVTQRGSETPIKKYETVDIHIIDGRKGRAAYGAKEQRAPSCASYDGNKTGTLNPEFAANLPYQIKTGQVCKICPMNQFKTAVDQNGNPGPGKFCGEKINLLAITQDFPDPVVFSIPTMSIKNWNAYADGLDKVSSTSFITQMTRVSVETVKRDAQTNYGTAKFETLGLLPPDIVKYGISVRAQFRDMLGTIAAEETASAPAPSAPEPPEEEPLPF